MGSASFDEFYRDQRVLRRRHERGVHEAEAFADPAVPGGLRFAVITVPTSAIDGSARASVEVRQPDGAWQPVDVPLDLAVLGG